MFKYKSKFGLKTFLVILLFIKTFQLFKARAIKIKTGLLPSTFNQKKSHRILNIHFLHYRTTAILQTIPCLFHFILFFVLKTGILSCTFGQRQSINAVLYITHLIIFSITHHNNITTKNVTLPGVLDTITH